MQFICPHCQATLNVPPQYLGQRGKCNKCGARIALIGDADAPAPQPASKLADAPPSPPATERQREYLQDLGVAPARTAHLDREQASDLIDSQKAAKRAAQPPTEKQLAYLAHLGATARQIERCASKDDASLLVEAMHIAPTRGQLNTLHALGASGAQIAALKSSGAAEELMFQLQA